MKALINCWLVNLRDSFIGHDILSRFHFEATVQCSLLKIWLGSRWSAIPKTLLKLYTWYFCESRKILGHVPWCPKAFEEVSCFLHNNKNINITAPLAHNPFFEVVRTIIKLRHYGTLLLPNKNQQLPYIDFPETKWERSTHHNREFSWPILAIIVRQI